MKNQTLIPVLLPTEDASDLFFDNFKNLRTSERKEHYPTSHHLYLTSDAPIKDGEWRLVNISITKEEKKWLVTNRSGYIGQQLKIEFTTDPKLIADGVPAIDGNTKAKVNGKDTLGSTIDDVYVSVNFLKEFCKRYNQKDNQKVDVDFKSELEKIWEDKNHTNDTFFDAIVKLHSQALQSNAGGFSLEDIDNALKMAWLEGWDNAKGISKKLRPDWHKEYLSELSLTKETPKGDIVIECEMEEVYQNIGGIKIDYQKIKLKDKQPVLIFR